MLSSDAIAAALKEWLPLLITLTTIVGGFILYSFQKKIERQHQRITEKSNLYRSFVRSVHKTKWRLFLAEEQADIAQEISEIQGLASEIMVVAPDRVAMRCAKVVGAFGTAALSKWHGAEGTVVERLEDVEKKLREATYHMRIDLFGASEVLSDSVDAWILKIAEDFSRKPN